MATIPAETITSDKQEMEAFEHVRKLKRFYLHAFRYVVVMLILFTINWLTGPQRLWVVWVAAGWGIGLAFHAFRVFGPVWMLGPEWEKRQVEKRLGRPL